jgi:hypothetical protein
MLVRTPEAVAALGVFLGIHVNTNDFAKTRQKSPDFGKTTTTLAK